MRISDKIEEIEKYISELEEFIPADFQEYEMDIKKKAASEKYFEKIVEAIVDLAFLVIKEKDYKIPEEDKQAFDVLDSEEMISSGLSAKLKDAKGMRNIIAHEYGKIDDKLVFHSIKEELIKDANEFLKSMKKGLKSD